MSYQEKTGPLMSHSVSYDGQDAYNDMFVTENRYANELGWHTDSSDIDTEQCRGGQRMPDKENFNCVIGGVLNWKQ